MASVLAGLVSLLLCATVTKIAVWLFSPTSPNGLLRAVAVNLVTVLGFFGLVFAGTVLPPLLVSLLLFAWPFAVLKVAYRMSVLRTVIVALAIGILLFLLQVFLLSGAPPRPKPVIDGQAHLPLPGLGERERVRGCVELVAWSAFAASTAALGRTSTNPGPPPNSGLVGEAVDWLREASRLPQRTMGEAAHTRRRPDGQAPAYMCG